MSKKGKIILWSVILVLVAAVAIILITTSLNGGARDISISKFKEYANNAELIRKDGKLKEGVTAADIEAKGYKLDANGYVVNEVNGKDVRVVVF